MIFHVPTTSDTSIDFYHLSNSSIHLNVADERNQNLTAAQREYLHKRKRVSHANRQWYQEPMRDCKFDNGSGEILTLPPVLQTQHPTTKNCRICKCAGCLLGRLGKRHLDDSNNTTTTD